MWRRSPDIRCPSTSELPSAGWSRLQMARAHRRKAADDRAGEPGPWQPRMAVGRPGRAGRGNRDRHGAGLRGRAGAGARPAAEHRRQRAGLLEGHDPDLPDGVVRRIRRARGAGRAESARSAPAGLPSPQRYGPDRLPLASDAALPHPPGIAQRGLHRQVVGGLRRERLPVRIRSKQPQPLLAQLPTATYEAYNAWGGDSLYPGGRRVQITGTTQGVAVSYDGRMTASPGPGSSSRAMSP